MKQHKSLVADMVRSHEECKSDLQKKESNEIL